ncbi:hypothetical protein JXA88_13760 [Candidatus Fermentibacteria bacterium]|nr:hypothetical protein [Candidatus Fermentibacteria bacterium]
MKGARAFLVGGLICGLAGVGLSYPWPFDHATSSQQVIRQTVGAYRHGTTENPNRLHAGVDIQPAPGISDTLYAISTAVVRYIYPADSSWFWAGDAAWQNGFGYVHVLIDTSAVREGSTISLAQAIGRVRPNANHLHLNDGPASGPAIKNNPLLFLDSFVDTIPPIVDSLTFCRQGSSSVVLQDTLTGKVDIAVAGRDSLSPEGTDEELMPYRLGFRIYTHETDSLVLDKFSDPTIRFTQVASHSGLGTTIHKSVYASRPEYWITNTCVDGTQPANRFWNTRTGVGDAWDADSSATRNEDARWSDWAIGGEPAIDTDTDSDCGSGKRRLREV